MNSKYDKGYAFHRDRMELPSKGDWAVALIAVIGWLYIAGVLQ